MTEAKSSKQMRVPMDWQDDGDMSYPHADNVFVRRMGSVFRITFGRASLPLKVRLDDEDVARMETEGVPVIPVSSVAVSVVDLPRIINIMSRLVDSTEDNTDEIEESNIELEIGDVSE